MCNLDCLVQAQLKNVNFGYDDHFAVLDFYSANCASTGHSYLYISFGMLQDICVNGRFVSERVIRDELLSLIGGKVSQVYNPGKWMLEFSNGTSITLPTPFQFQPNVWVR
jgi:hypothetical protein